MAAVDDDLPFLPTDATTARSSVAAQQAAHAAENPGAVSSATTSEDLPFSPPPSPQGLLNRSWLVPGKQEFQPDDTMKELRGAFGEGFNATVLPSETRPGLRSILGPQTQRQLQTPGEGGWSTGRSVWGPVLNAAGDLVGTGAADVAGAANSVLALGNQTLRSIGLPDNLIRDINLEMTNLHQPEFRAVPRLVPTEIKDAVRELSAPPAPTLSDLLQRQRAAPSTDPVTSEAISILRRATTPQGDIPPPPFPSATPPRPTPAPNGGLLSIPPSPGGPLPGAAPAMTADEMLANSRGWYSPADKQAAQGAVLQPQAGNSVRSILTDAIPTDPEKAALVGDTPLVQMGKAVKPYMDTPMSFDTAMSYDRELGGRIQVALRAGDNTLAAQLGKAQDAIREKMGSFGPGDTTGDPAALANLAKARQGFTQYVKQSQLEDINYRASLLPDDKQSAFVQSRARTLLGSDATRNWSPEERAILEDAVKSGNMNAFQRFAVSTVKPLARAGGATIGSVAGTPGAIVGAEIGGDMGATAAAALRRRWQQTTLDAVSQLLTKGMPPSPPGAP